MKITKKISLVVALLMLTSLVEASGKVVRATEIASGNWSDLSKSELEGIVVEFHQGDELPLSFQAQGDLMETRKNSISTVVIKKDFWIRLRTNVVEISFDGTNFKKIEEVATGSIQAGAGSAQNGGLADAINVVFKTSLRQ